jgi:hypothetical protein
VTSTGLSKDNSFSYLKTTQVSMGDRGGERYNKSRELKSITGRNEA